MPNLSVAELIRAAEREALRTQGQTGPADAIALAAGWLTVLQAAHEAAAALPGPGPHTGTATAPAHYLTVRIAQMASQARLFRPPQAAPLPAMTNIATTLHDAATLLSRDAHAWTAADPQARQDAAAARVRIAKTVAALAHAIARDMHALSGQLLHDQRATPRRRPGPAVMSTDTRARWVRMAQTHEQRALEYVTSHSGQAHHDRPTAAPAASSVGLLLATWSATAIRASADPHVSSTELARIGRTQAALLRTATALTAAAVHRGELDATVGPHLLHRLDVAAARWHDAAQHWTWARTPEPPPPSTDTVTTGRAVFTALEALTRGAGGWLTPQQIEQRLHGAPIVPLVQSVTETSQVLADTYEHLPHELHQAGRLRAPAATLLAITKEHYARTGARSLDPDENASPATLPVNLADVTANRLLPLTPAAGAVLRANGTELAGAAHAAHEALLLNTPPSLTRGEPASPDAAAASQLPARAPEPPQHRPQPGPGITP